jgi:hypothetical protein
MGVTRPSGLARAYHGARLIAVDMLVKTGYHLLKHASQPVTYTPELVLFT